MLSTAILENPLPGWPQTTWLWEAVQPGGKTGSCLGGEGSPNRQGRAGCKPCLAADALPRHSFKALHSSFWGFSYLIFSSSCAAHSSPAKVRTGSVWDSYRRALRASTQKALCSLHFSGHCILPNNQFWTLSLLTMSTGTG